MTPTPEPYVTAKAQQATPPARPGTPALARRPCGCGDRSPAEAAIAAHSADIAGDPHAAYETLARGYRARANAILHAAAEVPQSALHIAQTLLGVAHDLEMQAKAGRLVTLGGGSE